jgi:hypothetical protein
MGMNSAAIKTFITAGRAVFTLQSVKTNTHFTYKVEAPRNGNDIRFVKVLTGPDTYTYAGILTPKGIKQTGGSKIGPDAPSVKGLDWFLSHMDSDQVIFRHEGCCGRCGRPLTTPESIDRGIGPDCAEKMGL